MTETGPGDADPPAGGADVLFRIRELTKHFPIRGGLLNRVVATVRAVDGVSFDVMRGETIGMVGESGCGKTTTARLLLRLVEATSGELVFEGQDLRGLTHAQLKPFRARMQIIFQDPHASLNPRLPVGDIIGEGLYNFGVKKGAERERRVADMLDQVGLRRYYINRYPHEFSGGQRQRISIARALVLRPSFVIADEPVSALDVSTQAQVLNLLKDLQAEFGLTYLFISHNLAVIEHVSDRVAVMHLGKLVEIAGSRQLYRAARHPYTQALLSAIPVSDPEIRRERVTLRGELPSPVDPPCGCRFHTRCPVGLEAQAATAISNALRGPRSRETSPCVALEPVLEASRGDNGHRVACHFVDRGPPSSGVTAGAGIESRPGVSPGAGFQTSP